jgi:nucleoside-diphosphate-sugar epimerase
LNTDKKVLITGVTGFLGSNLAIKLLELGYSVFGIGRNTLKGQELQNKGIKFKAVDISDKNALIEVSKEIDYIVHCAAKSSLWGKWEDFYNTNVIGTKNIIEVCKINNIKRLIHISSPSIYFNFRDKLNIKENDELPDKKVNFYAETKYLAELEIDKANNAGLNTITLRPRAIWGNGDTSIFPRLIKANNKRFIPKTRNKGLYIDITHVDNVVESIILALNAPNNCNGEKYNITNDEPVELYSFIQKLIEELGYKCNFKKFPYLFLYFLAYFEELKNKIFTPNIEPIFTRYSLGLISFSQTLNIDKAKTELRYKPIKSVDEGIREYILANKNDKS